ncbi:MAG: hypothetical protein ACEQSF_05925 [Solirubrobacteraceae bacterium]
MQKTSFLIGFILGFLVTLLGTFLFVKIFTSYDYFYAVSVMKSGSNLSKLLSIGAILNILLVFFLFYKDKDEIAKGVVFSVILLFILTFFI